MEDLAARCMRQLATFRIKELKDVLDRMGFTKQGKKQDLIDKIMSAVTSETEALGSQGWKSNKYATTREDVAKAIDDIYRKMYGNYADDLASKGPTALGNNSLSRSDDHEEAGCWGETKTRCPCGSSIDAGTMIQCDDVNCGVWQHFNCVIIPEKEGLQAEDPLQFYCELCRIQCGDPFCVSVSHPLLPTKLTTSINTTNGSNPMQTLEKQFQLSRTDLENLQRPNHDLQVWCMLLNDKVPFRMHWPIYSDLRINGHQIRVTTRPVQQLLGANGRDDGLRITAYTTEGLIKISFSAYDARPFCLGIRIIRRLTVQQVLQSVPSQSTGEPFDAALARVRRCIGGGSGGGLENDNDSDSDLEVVSDSVPVTLRCPMSGSRMKIAARFKPCLHIRCFDMHTFLELNQRTRKWQCPICLNNHTLENLIIDPFFNVVIAAMKNYDESVAEVEVKPDGFWRPKLEGDARLHEPWRASDGSVSVAASQPPNGKAPLKSVKINEVLTDEKETLKIGIKRTRDGHWQVNRLTPSGANSNLLQRSNGPISQSSSATASNEDNPSVNQVLNKPVSHVSRKEVEVNSCTGKQTFPWDRSEVAGVDEQPDKDSEVIVLSDSEEAIPDDFNLGSSGASGYAMFENAGRDEVSVLQPQLLTEGVLSDGPFHFATEDDDDDVLLDTTRLQSQIAHAPLDFFATNGNETVPENNSWQAQSDVGQFEFFGVDSDSSQPISKRGQVRRRSKSPLHVSQYGSSSTSEHHERNNTQGSHYQRNVISGNGSNDYVVSERNNDPSLHLFLPPQQAQAVSQPSFRRPPASVVNEDVRDNWFSLRLGSGISMLDSENVMPASNENRDVEERGQLAASVLLGMSSNGNSLPVKSKALQVPPKSQEFMKHRSNQRSRYYFRVESDSD